MRAAQAPSLPTNKPMAQAPRQNLPWSIRSAAQSVAEQSRHGRDGGIRHVNPRQRATLSPVGVPVMVRIAVSCLLASPSSCSLTAWSRRTYEH